MLSFDIRSLSEHAVVVNDELSVDDDVWQEGDPKPALPLQVRGRLSSAGADRFYWHGSIEGSVALECSRCLVETVAHVADETHIIFAEEGSEDVSEDPDVLLLDPRSNELDLRPAIREQWLLNVPSYALCRDDCKGLCAHCGAELNVAPCDCTQRAAGPIADALRNAQSH